MVHLIEVIGFSSPKSDPTFPGNDKFRAHRNAMLIEMQLAHSTTVIKILWVDTTRI